MQDSLSSIALGTSLVSADTKVQTLIITATKEPLPVIDDWQYQSNTVKVPRKTSQSAIVRGISC